MKIHHPEVAGQGAGMAGLEALRVRATAMAWTAGQGPLPDLPSNPGHIRVRLGVIPVRFTFAGRSQHLNDLSPTSECLRGSR